MLLCPPPRLGAGGGWEEIMKPSLVVPSVFLMLTFTPNHLQSSCFCFVLFFQSRESFQKILEINPQLQKQVKGENVPDVPADVFHLNPTFPSCSGLGLPSTRSLHLATKPQSGFAYTVTSSMITGCPAALLCSPTQRLCLPPFYIHHPPLEPSR